MVEQKGHDYDVILSELGSLLQALRLTRISYKNKIPSPENEHDGIQARQSALDDLEKFVDGLPTYVSRKPCSPSGLNLLSVACS